MVYFPSFLSRIRTQPTEYHLIYESDFFSLRKNPGNQYFGAEEYKFRIEVNFPSITLRNMHLKIQLISLQTSEIGFELERSLIYNRTTRTISHQNGSIIGICPIFGNPDWGNNGAPVVLSRYGPSTQTGVFIEDEGGLITSCGKIPFYYIETNLTDYSAYYYSDRNDVLLLWRVGVTYENTLDQLFNIYYFYGHISLMSTNFDIDARMDTDPTPFIVVGVLAALFLGFFLIIRSKLKTRKKTRKRHFRIGGGKKQVWKAKGRD